MAMKVSRTYGVQILIEKCGCKVQRDFSDAALKTPLNEEAVYTPCSKHKAKKDAAETIELILSEMLEKEAAEMGKEPLPALGLGHAVADVAAANQAGAQAGYRTPINKRPSAGSGKPGIRRASGEATTAAPVSRAVAESLAAGGTSSLDAELARAPEPQGGGRLGPISRAKVAELIDEADGEPVTPLDIILGVNDEGYKG